MQTPKATPPAAIPRVRVSVATQTLEVLARNPDHTETLLRRFPVSTSRYGLGTELGSLRTPLGRFQIGEKFGHGQPLGTVFRAREPAADVDPRAALTSAEEDLILSRILWLEGVEEQNANTRGRYIYIHGTNHEALIGQPASHGCVRMRNADVVELFELVPTGAEVRIER